MKTMMRMMLVLVLIPSPGLKSDGVPQSSQEQSQVVSDGLEIRIEPLKSVITSGDTLSLHVEIWNVSREDIFICKDFQGPNSACGNLRLNFNHGAGPRTGVSYDYFRAHGVANKELFASVLVREWISIPPKHFYGAIIEVDTNEYGMKGGRYQITGEYQSGGLLAEAVSNNLLSYREEVARLSGKSWRGRVDTNSVQVRVLPKK